MNDTLLAGVTRPCHMCMTRHPVTAMDEGSSGMWRCKDLAGCAARQDAAGPQAETPAGIELAVSRREVIQGVPSALPDDMAADIRPRAALTTKGA
jgi:hypothetical protein